MVIKKYGAHVSRGAILSFHLFKAFAEIESNFKSDFCIRKDLFFYYNYAAAIIDLKLLSYHLL